MATEGTDNGVKAWEPIEHDPWIGSRPKVAATGVIDEVRLYMRALSAAEVTVLSKK